MKTHDVNYGDTLQRDFTLSKIHDFDILLERILLEARRIVHADAGSIYVREVVTEKENPVEKLCIKYSQNDTLSAMLPEGEKLIYSFFSIPIDEKTISGYCALTRKIVNVPDMYNIEKGAPYSFNPKYDAISHYRTVSTLTIPLINSYDRLIGVIQVINSHNESGEIVPFSKMDETRISRFAFIASRALQSAYTTRTMVLRTIKLAELRDPKETSLHANSVASYAVEIYSRWAYLHTIPAVQREIFKDNFRIAAMLHDVGKVAVSDAILKKPGRFTEEEYFAMQRHTVQGAKLFKDPQSPLDEISLDVVLTHHENWDGTGYPGWIDPFTEKPLKTGKDGKPMGKRGEEIPLAGRIAAIADVFDALSSRRVYKEAWKEDKVLEEMKKMRGAKFDPELTDIFFDIYPSIKYIQSMYKEEGTP